MKIKFLLGVFLVMCTLNLQAQQKDTAQTLCWYVTDVGTGASVTGYVYRVNTYKYEFVQPNQADLNSKDSVTLHKQKTLAASDFFIDLKDTASKVFVLTDFNIDVDKFKKAYKSLPAKYSTIQLRNEGTNSKPTTTKRYGG